VCVVKSRDRVKLVGCKHCPVVEGDDVCGLDIVVFAAVAVEDWEGRLAAMMEEEEVAGGGDAAPDAADGAAAEEGFGVEADEDLAYDDIIWEAMEERRGS
jgi:hypothetical protein